MSTLYLYSILLYEACSIYWAWRLINGCKNVSSSVTSLSVFLSLFIASIASLFNLICLPHFRKLTSGFFFSPIFNISYFDCAIVSRLLNLFEHVYRFPAHGEAYALVDLSSQASFGEGCARASCRLWRPERKTASKKAGVGGEAHRLRCKHFNKVCWC